MILINFGFSFKGRESIKEKLGFIYCNYYIRSTSILGLPHVVCRVAIDMKNKSLIQFTAFGGEHLVSFPLDTSQWTIGIDSLFEAIEQNGGNDYLARYDDPVVVVRTNDIMWEVAIYPKTGSMGEDVTTRFDAKTKKLIKLRDRWKQ